MKIIAFIITINNLRTFESFFFFFSVTGKMLKFEFTGHFSLTAGDSKIMLLRVKTLLVLGPSNAEQVFNVNVLK